MCTTCSHILKHRTFLSVFVGFVRFRGQTATVFLNSVTRSVFLMKTYSVLREVGTKFLLFFSWMYA